MSKRNSQSPEQFAAQRKKMRLLRHLAIAAAFVLLIVIDQLGWFPVARNSGTGTPGDDLAKYHNRTFSVVKVVDGDTIDIDVADGDRPTTRVRFWGIDTPEVARAEQGKAAEPFANEARAFTHERCMGRKVTLELQKHSTRGKFGRLLAYIRLNDGIDLNAALLEAGLARYEARFSHDRMDSYRELERMAKKAGRGMWSNSR